MTGPLSIDGLADDLAALLDTLGIESARVTGHSLGTLVTAVHLPSNRLSAEVKSLDDEHWDSSEVVPLWNTWRRQHNMVVVAEGPTTRPLTRLPQGALTERRD